MVVAKNLWDHYYIGIALTLYDFSTIVTWLHGALNCYRFPTNTTTRNQF